MLHTTRPKDFDVDFDTVGCFCECNGKILVLLRQDHKPQPNTWGVPTGKLDPGESHEAAAVRELFEETGIRITEAQLTEKTVTYVQFMEYDICWTIYKVHFDQEPAVTINPEEIKDYRWVTPAESLNMNYILGFDGGVKLFYPL